MIDTIVEREEREREKENTIYTWVRKMIDFWRRSHKEESEGRKRGGEKEEWKWQREKEGWRRRSIVDGWLIRVIEKEGNEMRKGIWEILDLESNEEKVENSRKMGCGESADEENIK